MCSCRDFDSSSEIILNIIALFDLAAETVSCSTLYLDLLNLYYGMYTTINFILLAMVRLESYYYYVLHLDATGILGHTVAE